MGGVGLYFTYKRTARPKMPSASERSEWDLPHKHPHPHAPWDSGLVATACPQRTCSSHQFLQEPARIHPSAASPFCNFFIPPSVCLFLFYFETMSSCQESYQNGTELPKYPLPRNSTQVSLPSTSILLPFLVLGPSCTAVPDGPVLRAPCLSPTLMALASAGSVGHFLMIRLRLSTFDKNVTEGMVCSSCASCRMVHVNLSRWWVTLTI